MTQNSTTYNGWINYPIWACYLWISSEEANYNSFLQLAQNHPEIYSLSVVTKEQIIENSPLCKQASLYSDLLAATIGKIDFNEIAQALLKEMNNLQSRDSESAKF